MPVKEGKQFNRPIVSNMNEVASPIVSQILQISIGSSQTKFIRGLHCSSIQQSFSVAALDAMAAIARVNIRCRVTVIGEEIDLSAFTAAQLLSGYTPIQTLISFGDYVPSNVYFDRMFLNFLVEDFSSPLIVPDGTPVTILMSQGFTDGDSILVSTTKIGSLNVRGEVVSETDRTFPFILR